MGAITTLVAALVVTVAAGTITLERVGGGDDFEVGIYLFLGVSQTLNAPVQRRAAQRTARCNRLVRSVRPKPALAGGWAAKNGSLFFDNKVLRPLQAVA